MSRIMEIKNRIMELIEQKVEKTQGIKILRKEFKGELEGQTEKDLIELWRITKEENKINAKNKHTPKKTVKEPKVVSNANTSKKEDKAILESENKAEISNKFKILKKVITIQGEYGTYVKDGSTVESNNLKFSNADDVAAYEKKLIAEEEELFLKRKAEIHARLIEYVDVMLMEV